MVRFLSRTFPLLLLLLGLGCAPESGDQPAAEESQDDAPPGYLGAIAGAKKSMEGDIALAPLQQAITAFKVAEGRNPESLQELVDLEFITALPDAPYRMTLEYDPKSGAVSVEPVE